MAKRIPLYLIIIAFSSFLNYFATKNLMYSLIVGIVGLITFLLLIEPMLSKFYLKVERTKECVWFINNFLITLSINQSIRMTFETLNESFSKTLKQQVKINENLDVESQIKSLKMYFNCDLYNVFLNLLDQYIYNGGDILKISQILLFDSRKIGDSLDNHLTLFKRKIIELASLWFLNFLILIIMKFSLNQFYYQIANNLYYTLGISTMFFINYLNIYVFILHATNLSFIQVGNFKLDRQKKLKIKKSNERRVKNEKNKRLNRKNK